jgi:N-acetyl-gamma-glutamyl-phosphate reductase
MDVGVVGGSGYGGAELLRLLAGHPTLRVARVAARTTAGARLAEVFPHLAGTSHAELEIVPAGVDQLQGCDVVFLATPHEVSLDLAPALVEAGVLVVDLSGAFRLPAGTFEAAYAMPHPAPGATPAAYGLPELFRPDLAGARLIASPGCYPTAALLALAPLAGLVGAETVTVVGLSGTSGAGKGLREDLHVTHAGANAAPYGAPSHRHTPEIARGWSRLTGAVAPVTFVPHLVPMARGLLATVTASLRADVDPAEVRAAYAKAYADEPFVTLLPEGVWPQTAHLRGGNGAHVAVAVDHVAGRAVASCAIDNLGKGAAGQALQAANVALGVDEAAGLTAAGVYP